MGSDTVRWDGVCPHCGEDLPDLFGAFVGRDYADEFVMEHEPCGRQVLVEVEMVPTFGVSIPSAPRTAPIDSIRAEPIE